MTAFRLFFLVLLSSGPAWAAPAEMWRTLKGAQVEGTLSGVYGAVEDVSISPQLPAVLEHQLIADAGKWLFLPSVKDGQPQPARATLPLRLHH